MKNSLTTELTKRPERQIEPHYRVCNYCEAMCGVSVTFDPAATTVEKRIVVKPDPKDPFSKGSMCPKAPSFGSIHHDPDRLKRPVTVSYTHLTLPTKA